MGVARELGYTLTKLWSETTPEEVILWSCYFQIINEDQEAAMKDKLGLGPGDSTPDHADGGKADAVVG